MTSTQIQARALGDPTRYRIFRYLADASVGVDVAELTSHLRLNHNAIRQHLAKLIEAELVVHGPSPRTGRGRPRLHFRVNPVAQDRWNGAGPYQRLSLLLAEVLRTGDDPVEVGRRAGRQIDLGPGASVQVRIGDAVARGGFEPQLVSGEASLNYVLQRCPFVDTAAAAPEVVCGLHRGLAEGMADQLESVTVVDLEAHDPNRAGCRLRFDLGTPTQN